MKISVSRILAVLGFCCCLSFPVFSSSPIAFADSTVKHSEESSSKDSDRRDAEHKPKIVKESKGEARKRIFEEELNKEKKRHKEAEESINKQYLFDKRKLQKELRKEYNRHIRKVQELIKKYHEMS